VDFDEKVYDRIVKLRSQEDEAVELDTAVMAQVIGKKNNKNFVCCTAAEFHFVKCATKTMYSNTSMWKSLHPITRFASSRHVSCFTPSRGLLHPVTWVASPRHVSCFLRHVGCFPHHVGCFPPSRGLLNPVTWVASPRDMGCFTPSRGLLHPVTWVASPGHMGWFRDKCKTVCFTAGEDCLWVCLVVDQLFFSQQKVWLLQKRG